MKDKKTIILSVIAIATLIILTVGATYAYFTQTGGTGTQADVSVGTSKEDILTFEVGNPINIETNQTLFSENKGNASGTTYGKAILKTNNQTNELKANYYMYLNITTNELSYTKDTNTPELLLKVTDSNGTELTSITGLEYKTVTDGLGNTVKGFDITTKTGLITILNDQEIVAQPTKTDTWNVEVVFVNYNFDQSDNAGKIVNAYLQITKGENETSLADLCDGKTLSECVKAQYVTQGENNLYLHNGTITSDDGTVIDAKDRSYRYAGASEDVNNYVCFGSDEETCPTDSLYRIIGVFGDNVKLIKASRATSNALGKYGAYYNDTSYYWERFSLTDRDNTWSHSLLNTANLNTYYITYLNNQNIKWTNMIAKTTWKVGGNTDTKIRKVAMYTVYQNEIVNPATNTTDGKTEYEAQIGLMYVSDYGYAASPTYWTYLGYDSNGSWDGDNWFGNDYSKAKNENWMYSGVYEWTITRMSDDSSYAFDIFKNGFVEYSIVTRNTWGVRPVFYLTSSVKYDRGDGDSLSPIRVKL